MIHFNQLEPCKELLGMQMLGVIKNLIIIHLGSMHERIRPNRWINSERRDESLEGESVGHHLSAFAFRSGLHFAEKLQEAREKGALGFPGTAWLALHSWRNMVVSVHVSVFAF